MNTGQTETKKEEKKNPIKWEKKKSGLVHILVCASICYAHLRIYWYIKLCVLVVHIIIFSLAFGFNVSCLCVCICACILSCDVAADSMRVPSLFSVHIITVFCIYISLCELRIYFFLPTHFPFPFTQNSLGVCSLSFLGFYSFQCFSVIALVVYEEKGVFLSLQNHD